MSQCTRVEHVAYVGEILSGGVIGQQFQSEL